MSKEFIWTDELILKFAHYTYFESPAFQGRYKDIEDFKRLHSIDVGKDGDEIENDDLYKWVSVLKEVKWKNRLMVSFWWGVTPCAGIITITPYNKELRIMPCSNLDNIGSGAGQGIFISFKRMDIYKPR